jgi:sugar phosphate isomerase/epimerase
MKSRRKFIKHAGLMAAGSLIVPYACSPKKSEEGEADTLATETTKELINEAGKDIGLQLYTLRNEINNDGLEATLEKVAGIGYQWMEGFGYENGTILGKTPQEFSKIITDLGMSLPSMHAVTELTTSGGKSAIMDAMRKAAEDSKTAGAQYLVYAYLNETERTSLDDYKRHAETFNQFGEICKEVGLQFAYHNHDFEFETFEDTIAYDYLIENTDPELVKFELDLYWITKAGYNPIEYFEKANGRIELWHVKDMNNQEEKFFAPVGQGIIDFEAIFTKKDVSGMKFFFVEQDQTKEQPPIEAITDSYKFLNTAEFVS